MTKKKMLILAALVALAAALVVPMVVSGEYSDTGETTVSGNIGATYSVTAPENFGLGNFTAVQNYTSGNKQITATTNDSDKSTVTITVSDSKTSTKGYLTLVGQDDANKQLTNPLDVKGGAVINYTPLTSNQTLASNVNLSSGSYSISDFSVQQTISSADLLKTAGTYSITLTFTATFN